MAIAARLVMGLMRKTLLWASTNAWLRERATRTRFVRRSVSKFMPGEHIEDALAAARSLQASNVTAMFTRLGENLTCIEEAAEVDQHYRHVLDLLAGADVDGQISIKPTQLGFDQDPELCFRYCAGLLDRCDVAGTLFWLDMESSPYVDGTIALYKRLRERSANVGIAIQTYLHRSERDVEDLIPLGAAIRLVKGAYLEPSSVAMPRKADVDDNFFKLSARLLADDAARPGALLHIGTHDVALQDRIRKIIAERAVSPDRYAVAMLYGIKSGRQAELGLAGVRTRCLISYGEYWFPWYVRRLAERPANIGFVVRNMFG
jgi:proline dehydrogenase